jgi:hypothetical protein
VCMRDFDQYLTSHVSRQLYSKKDARTDPLETAEGAALPTQGVQDKDLTTVV